MRTGGYDDEEERHQKIPTPKFIVFYNGLDRKVPDRMELRLSDAYENPTDEPDLELKVRMSQESESM